MGFSFREFSVGGGRGVCPPSRSSRSSSSGSGTSSRSSTSSTVAVFTSAGFGEAGAFSSTLSTGRPISPAGDAMLSGLEYYAPMGWFWQRKGAWMECARSAIHPTLGKPMRRETSGDKDAVEANAGPTG